MSYTVEQRRALVFSWLDQWRRSFVVGRELAAASPSAATSNAMRALAEWQSELSRGVPLFDAAIAELRRRDQWRASWPRSANELVSEYARLSGGGLGVLGIDDVALIVAASVLVLAIGFFSIAESAARLGHVFIEVVRETAFPIGALVAVVAAGWWLIGRRKRG